MIKLMDLPYKNTDLEPYISKETIEHHYGKHHQTYVNKLNGLIANTKYGNLSLEKIILKSHKDKNLPIFNNSAQIWNHDFFWHGLTTEKNSKEKINKSKSIIENSFETVENFFQLFKQISMSHFGSGWVWITQNQEKNKLEIITTKNAELPIICNQKAIWTCDLWEHAYYIDYRNLRPKYLEEFWDHINWDFAEEAYEKTDNDILSA